MILFFESFRDVNRVSPDPRRLVDANNNALPPATAYNISRDINTVEVSLIVNILRSQGNTKKLAQQSKM